MNYVERLEILLNSSIEKIQNSSLVLELMKIYSDLYLEGKAPSDCTKCQRGYFDQLKKDGMQRAKHMDKVKVRTCKPNWKGLRYFSKAARHYNDETITDEEAIRGLQIGVFSESNFETLPEGYKNSNKIGEGADKCISEFKELLKSGETKKSIVETYAGEVIDGKKATKKYISELVDIANEA